MARSVDEVHITGWTNTGTTVPVPRWTVNVTFKWTNDAGQAQTNTATRSFPNMLAGVPTRRLREYMEAIILAEARIALGIDRDPDA